jgi:hypothetical protein
VRSASDISVKPAAKPMVKPPQDFQEESIFD